MTRAKRNLFLTTSLALLLFVTAPQTTAQQLASNARSFVPTRMDSYDAAANTPTIKIDVPLVMLTVTVTDRMNRLVTGLRQEDFEIEEDKIGQRITQFGAQDAPLSIGLVVDSSGSMGYKMAKTREAVSEFLKTSDPDDEFFLTQFNQRPRMVASFTAHGADIQNQLIYAESKGRTALIDAVYLAVSQMRRASNPRKAILIISDGGDNSSRYTERELRRLVKEADVQIFAIGIFEPIGGRARTPEELAGPDLLSRICEITGGMQFPVENINDLPDVVSTIGLALRNQYVLGYIPSNQEKDGKWRRLRVGIREIGKLGRLQTYSRLGYYAPTR